MNLTASDFYLYHRPQECGLRVFLREKGEKESPPGPFDEVIKELGKRHEKQHLASFPCVVDLSSGVFEDRLKRSKEEVQKGTSVIYQPVFKVSNTFQKGSAEIIGEPDFLIRDGNGYIVRDTKIAKRITQEDHPEILLQLGIYGWLFEKTFGVKPRGLQVYGGNSETICLPYDDGFQALADLGKILNLKKLEDEPYSPVGWSKCTACGFHDRCWSKAEAKKDVSLVYGVDKGLALALKNVGVETVQELLNRFDIESLAEFKRPRGDKEQKVGKTALKVINMAGAMLNGKEIILKKPELPVHPTYVMFDIEGFPAYIEPKTKIYLWGLTIFNGKEGEFIPALSGFGEKGDKEGWEAFIKNAGGIFKQYGDIPFVHWAEYEKTHVKAYIEEYGDKDGIAQRVLDNLFDLLKETRSSIAIPRPSYSLKVIEKYIGYERKLKEGKGDWAMAKYIEATETRDEKLRSEIMDEIIQYNKEDLEATWAVFEWLKGK